MTIGTENSVCYPTNDPYYEYDCSCSTGHAVCTPRETCPVERRHCGPCCPPGQICNTLLEKCMCKQGERCGSQCCKPGTDRCVNTRLPSKHPGRFVCCKPPNRCNAGICLCPNGDRSCGGSTCCKAPTSQCQRCIDTSNTLQPQYTAQAKCCPPNHKCCGSKCCKESEGCCGSKCCPEGSGCATAAGKSTVCCPAERALPVPNVGAWCCPPGTTNVAGKGCCPPGQPDCCPPTDGAGNVLDCNRGGKVCVRGTCVSS